MRFQPLPICSVLMFLLIPTSCLRREEPEFRRSPRYGGQFRALSATRPGHVSIITESSRELRVTSDGGQTWQTIPAKATGDGFECAAFADNGRGWAVNHQGQVFITDSGGISWTKISELQDFIGANQIEFVNQNDGWIMESLAISRTTDGGITWRPTLSTSTPGVLGQPSSFFAIDANTLVSSGNAGQVYLTRDGGETWKLQTPLAGNVTFSDVWFKDPKHGWLTGYAVLVAGKSLRGLLFETTDGGESWQETVLPDSQILPTSVCFVGDEGWLAGTRRLVSESVKLEGVLLHTIDAGKHWTPVQLDSTDEYLGEVRFSDKDEGWLVGRDNLYHTEDGGKTWKRVLSLPSPT